jgi:trimethylamine--corrinoid protein Co-methyltransferase
MDEEISAMSKRIAEGLVINDETIAADLIKGIGPGSADDAYLTAGHTLKWLRSDEYLATRVSVRENRATWESSGSKDTYQIARDRVKQFSTENPVPFDRERAEKLNEIVNKFRSGRE